MKARQSFSVTVRPSAPALRQAQTAARCWIAVFGEPPPRR